MEDEQKQEAIRRIRLVMEGDFEQAITSIDLSIERDHEEDLLFRERGHIYLYSGHTQKARADFDMSAHLNERCFQTKPGRLQSDSEISAIGLTYWMEGHRELALAFWRYATSSLMNNRVSYASISGGIETGLLLWYGAALERNAHDIELVKEFYIRRLASTFWSHNLTSWPGPIVRFFLKQIDDDELIKEAWKNEIRPAEEPKQQICDAHLALAARARENCRYVASKKYLRTAACVGRDVDMYDYYNDMSFFLARFEIGEIEVK